MVKINSLSLINYIFDISLDLFGIRNQTIKTKQFKKVLLEAHTTRSPINFNVKDMQPYFGHVVRREKHLVTNRMIEVKHSKGKYFRWTYKVAKI